MCHLYDVNADPGKLAESCDARYEAAADDADRLVKADKYPLSAAPVVYSGDGGRVLEVMQWGLLPHWWKPSPKSSAPKTFQRKTFNARAETVHQKPSFRDSFKKRRALVPAEKFFEKGKWLRRSDEPLMVFAGLWEEWRGSEEAPLRSFTILTCDPNSLIESIGHPRMPVILENDAAFARWLDPAAGREALTDLLAPFPAERMELVE